MKEIPLASLRDTQELGARLGAAASADTTIALVGDLGAGKTSFTQGLGRALGVQGPVQSPTFIVVQEHEEGRLPLFHADLYRVESERELVNTGIEDMLESGGVCVIEWADRFPDLLPADHLRIEILHAGEGRLARVFAKGPAHAALLERALD